jgi:4-amino-4-deoxy-L-arabinose transferase-like glycosyltransferase
MRDLVKYKNQILILIIGIIIYLPFLGIVHLFDWDEINFAESAREMLISGNYLDVQINFAQFWEKPPLFIWMQAGAMKIFGINEFAARFPNAICGIVTLLAVFNTGKKFRDEKFGWIWLMTYACSILPFLYFKSGIIDPWFNLFIFLGITNFIYYLNSGEHRNRDLVLSAFLLGLAVLTKGPAAVLIFGLSLFVYLVFVRFRIQTSIKDVLVFLLILSFTGGFWFILQIFNGNYGIIRDFIVYQIRLFKTKDAGHGGFLLYHFVVVFAGVFPASVFAIFNLFKKDEDLNGDTTFSIWMQILLFVVLILFTIVSTKIVHYSSLAYFPLTFIASVYIRKIISGEVHTGRMLRYLITFISFIYGSFVVALAYIDILKDRIIARGWIKDGFAIGNLDATGGWMPYDIIPGVLFILLCFWFVTRFARDPLRSIRGVFISTLLFIFITMAEITPKIEAYSQRAAIEFYQSVAGEDAYITTIGFKSYAHLFYAKVSPPKNRSVYEKGWLLTGKIDKPVYVICKINRKERYLREYPDLKIISEKNGFVFTRRDPKP